MKKKNRIILLGAPAILVLFTVLKLADNKDTIDQRAEHALQQQVFDRIPVKTVAATMQATSNTLSLTGTFAPQQDLQLTAQAQGQVNTLFVKEGQFVQKGTLLAAIDNSALASQIAAARTALDNAEQDAQRMRNAFSTGGVTQQDVENAGLKARNAKSSLAQLQQQEANYRVTAPVSGVVNKIFAEQGSFVSPGTAVLQLVDITRVVLNVAVDQVYVPLLKPGMAVKVSSEVYPGVDLKGRVETVNVQADASQKITVGVYVDNSREHPLLGGMFGRADFNFSGTDTLKSALTIPRAALVGSVQAPEVFVVKADSTVDLRAIRVEQSLGKVVHVTEGLAAGEQVVTAGQINLEEGARVTVKN